MKCFFFTCTYTYLWVCCLRVSHYLTYILSLAREVSAVGGALTDLNDIYTRQKATKRSHHPSLPSFTQPTPIRSQATQHSSLAATYTPSYLNPYPIQSHSLALDPDQSPDIDQLLRLYVSLSNQRPLVTATGSQLIPVKSNTHCTASITSCTRVAL